LVPPRPPAPACCLASLMTLPCNPVDRDARGRMLDLAVVSRMRWAVPATPVGAAPLTLPVRGSGEDISRCRRILPVTLSEHRLPFAVSSAGVP
jgi:hypothetical protein